MQEPKRSETGAPAGDEPTLRSPDAPPREPRDHAALPPGVLLQEYTLEAVLGAGSSGITYLARDNNLQCQVAIKEYLPSDLVVRIGGNSVHPRTEADTAAYREGLERFLAEARVLATFRHPNIVRVMRFFEAHNTAYMVMEYEKGESLRAWQAGHGPVAEAELLRMFLPLLEGIEVVHRSGVTHRDIKPANIYVRDDDGSLVLIDFGAARNAVGGTSRSLTSMVTPGYAPFEQYHTHGKQGPWSDIYSLGCVLYWLVTGDKPLEAPSRVRNDAMTPAAQAGGGRYSPTFLAAIDWALAIDEERRPRDIGAFRASLTGERAAPGKGAETKAVAASGRQSLLPLAGVAALLAAAVGGYFALSSGRAVAPESAQKAETAAPSAVRVSVQVPAPVPAPAPAPSPKAKPLPAAERKAAAANSTSAAKPAPPAKQASAAKPTATVTPAPASEAMATLIFEIRPEGAAGEVSIDGVKVGVAPPMKEFRVPPGKHRIDVLRTQWIGSYRGSVEVKASEKKTIWVAFPAS